MDTSEFTSYILLFSSLKLPVLLFIFPPFDRACFSLKVFNLVLEKRRANGNLPNDGVRVNGQTFVSDMINLRAKSNSYFITQQTDKPLGHLRYYVKECHSIQFTDAV